MFKDWKFYTWVIGWGITAGFYFEPSWQPYFAVWAGFWAVWSWFLICLLVFVVKEGAGD